MAASHRLTTLMRHPFHGLPTRTRWMMVLSLVVLSVILFGLAVLDYLRVQTLTETLAADQARVLIAHVEQSTARAAVAEEVVWEAVNEQLFAASRLLERIISTSGGGLDWPRLAAEAGVSRLDLYAWDLRWMAGSHLTSTSPFPRSSLDAQQATWTTGLFNDSLSGASYYGVVRRLDDGKLLRVALDSALLLEMRRTVGLSALLQDLASHPEVRYAVLDSPHQLLAATPNLPAWVEAPGEGTHDEALATQDFQTLVIDSPEGPVHEARTPFAGAPGTVIRLGLVQPGLQQILARARWAILLRTGLILGLGGLGLVLLISRQHLQLLAREKEQMEAEVRSLMAGRELQERQVAMGSLAGGVAHEIRSPLNTIAMAAQRLEFQLDPQQHREHYQDLVRNIRHEAQRIERIVADFLAFARPPKAQRVLQDPVQALRQVTETFTSLALARGVQFQVQLEALPKAMLDADQIRQAVLNLLMNALQAVPKEGAQISFTARRERGALHLCVDDNGPGVPEEQRRKIFDLYFTTRAEGTGIGLPLVQRVASQHGGRVDVSSSPLGGASFVLIVESES